MIQAYTNNNINNAINNINNSNNSNEVIDDDLESINEIQKEQ